MRCSEPKKRKAWLITWESSREDYLAELNRPRVVAILNSVYSPHTIGTVLPVLFTSESKLTFGEKIGYSFCKQRGKWLREEVDSIFCGDNPRLRARIVKDLYVQGYENTVWRQTLHWTEFARKEEDPETFESIVVQAERQCSEDVNFDVLWYGKSFLEEDEERVHLEGSQQPSLSLKILTGQADVEIVES